MSKSLVKCSWVKCSEVLQCSDGLSNKVSNVIRRHIDNMQLMLICILLLSHSFLFFGFHFFCLCTYGCIPVSYCNLCIFIVMSMYSYCMFMYLHRASWHSSATLTEGFPCFFLKNARVKLTKMGHGQHFNFCVVLCFVFV